MKMFIWMFLSLSAYSLVVESGWQTNLRPKLFLEMSSRDFTAFEGNSSFRDYFSVILPIDDGKFLLVGARNVLYKLEFSDDLRLRQRLDWHSEQIDIEACLVKGKSPEECQNYIAVLAQYENDRERYLLCGTNAFKPMCREYVDERGTYVQGKEKRGLGMCPYSPNHNSTAVLVGEDLFAGTMADIAGVDPIIFRNPQRTRQYDPTQLNSPDFVGSFAHGDYVYFFFREGAVEYINCGKAVFSRVARICKNDKGGPNKARLTWTSFLKTRLNCSVPGEFPFYFDEIQGVTDLIVGKYAQEEEDHIIYGTFSTPENSIGGSAVCAFRLRDISDSFSGKFKEQRDSSANWLPVPAHEVPSPRPGVCINDTKTLGDEHLNFIKKHSLMDETISPFFGAPVVIRTGLISRFMTLAVDPQISTTDGKTYDIIFIGTTNGRIIKAINALSADSRTEVNTVIIEELQVFSQSTIVKQIKVVGGEKEGPGRSLAKLAVMASDELRSFPVQRCDRASTCQECVALQDPYCAWDVRSARCGSGDWTKNMASSFIQSVATGVHSHCPPSPPLGGKSTTAKGSEGDSTESSSDWNQIVPVGLVINIVHRDESDKNKNNNERNVAKSENSPGVQVVESSAVLFSLETLVITVSAGAVAALVVGFVIGYCCGRKCGKESTHLPYPDTDYEYFEQRQGLARPMAPLLPTAADKIDTRGQEEVTYAEPELVARPLPPQLNALNTMGGKYYDNDRYSGGGDGVGGGSSHYCSSLLQPNKFNTIHSVNKRSKSGGGNGGGGGGEGPSSSSSSSGAGRASMRGSSSNIKASGGGSGVGGGGGSGNGGGGSGNNSTIPETDLNQQQQVVDSAYGTTRSVKKVYL